MKVYLIIKGDVSEAKKAAEKRGITISEVCDFNAYPDETRADADSDIDTLNKWFCEEKTDKEFQPGTLLFWTPVPIS